VHVALHDVGKGRRKFVAVLCAAAGNAFIPEKSVALIDAKHKAQQRRYGSHIASVVVQRVRQHGQLLVDECAIQAGMALNFRQHVASVQDNIAVFDVTPHRPDANIRQKPYGLVVHVRDGLDSQDHMVQFGMHVAKNYPDHPVVEKIILLQRAKDFGPRDVMELPVYHRVLLGACSAVQLQQHLVVSDTARPRV